MNYSNQPYRPGGFQVIPPAIKAIILVNVGVFLLENLPAFSGVLLSEFALWPVGSGNFRIWQPLTYLFLHGGTAHIFFNMFALWIFGAEIENYWGTKQFNIYYFTCGIGAALINLLATAGSTYPTIGASGAVYGVLLAFGMMFPDRYIFLYFLFPIKAKFFVAGYAFIEFFSGLGSRTMGSGSNIAHFAHLGGMLIGWIYITLKRRDVSFDGVLEKIRRPVKRGSARIHSITRSDESASEAEIDRILEKITRSGYSSLSAEERRKLLKAGKK
ncbi:rhomboid family intramembrane serine protease [Chlorobium sp. N1]|uniref:rhomboid family intramembrane serine protease n=1 Tax=Chlorobium sp. N1 TaxID=2491138 RepID=UPI00103A8373|nr:rhomboid family intramembrane serine protease [Chlorobium sp. N1]TCD48192.1 rhomboid family intramembrane serine protease [Chlorobium sp. N1]